MTPADVIVLKGQPTDEEIAALVAVLTALGARAATAAETTRSGDMWSAGPGRPAFRPPGAWTPLRPRRAA